MDMQPDPKIIAKFALVGLSVLTARALTWATMLITAGMFGYALYAPDALRIGCATIFALLVFWRVTWIERKSEPRIQGEQNGE